MNLLLQRFAYFDTETLGHLSDAAGSKFNLYTVECPWKENLPGVSCIPVGEYELEPHSSDRYGSTWAFVGAGVSHFEEPNATRFACLLHTANLASELKGCAAPGISLGFFRSEGEWKRGVTSSRVAMDTLREVLKPGTTNRISIVPHF